MSRAWQFTGMLLIAMALFLHPDSRFSLSRTEGETFWIIRDDVNWQIAPRGDFARNLREDWRLLGDHLRQAEATPLYYAVLDGWEIVAGESIWAMRWLSTLMVVLGLAGLAGVARRIHPVISPALIVVLGTFTLIYPATSVDFYAFLFLNIAWSTLLFTIWQTTQRGIKRLLVALAYIVTVSALALTCPLTLLVGVAHGVYAFRTERMREWLAAVMSVTGIALIYYGLFAFGVITPRMMLTSVWVMTLSAIILGVAWMSQRGRRDLPEQWRGGVLLAMIVSFLMIGLLVNQALLSAHPNWEQWADDLNAARQPLETGITVLDERHPLMQIDRQPEQVWRWGVWVDLGWQEQTAVSVQIALEKLGGGIHWAIIDAQNPNADLVRDSLPPYSHLSSVADGVEVWTFGRYDD